MEYSIGDFSRLTGLGIHTLRYYEQDGKYGHFVDFNGDRYFL